MFLESWMVPFLVVIFGCLGASLFSLVKLKNKKLAFIFSIIASSQIIVLLVLGLVYGKKAERIETPSFFEGMN